MWMSLRKRPKVIRGLYTPTMKDPLDVDGLDALLVAGRRLRDLDPERFARVLKICRTYVAIYDRPNEPEEIFASRLAELCPRGPKVLA